MNVGKGITILHAHVCVSLFRQPHQYPPSVSLRVRAVTGNNGAAVNWMPAGKQSLTGQRVHYHFTVLLCVIFTAQHVQQNEREGTCKKARHVLHRLEFGKWHRNPFITRIQHDYVNQPSNAIWCFSLRFNSTKWNNSIYCTLRMCFFISANRM